MNVLTLSIKQKPFDEIVEGVKKEEFREIRPSNAKRYVYYKVDGAICKNGDDIPEDAQDVEVLPVEYDALKLVTGEYKGKRPFVVIEVKSSEVQFLTDEEDNDITYEHEGEEYVASQIRYELGDILDRSNI